MDDLNPDQEDVIRISVYVDAVRNMDQHKPEWHFFPDVDMKHFYSDQPIILITYVPANTAGVLTSSWTYDGFKW